MSKFDASCGLTKKEIDIIKFSVKREISMHLPILPDQIETKLFLQGRDAWLFNWNLINKYPIESNHSISLEVNVKLKKEFHHCVECINFKYSCMVKLRQDIYNPEISVVRAED